MAEKVHKWLPLNATAVQLVYVRSAGNKQLENKFMPPKTHGVQSVLTVFNSWIGVEKCPINNSRPFSSLLIFCF